MNIDIFAESHTILRYTKITVEEDNNRSYDSSSKGPTSIANR